MAEELHWFVGYTRSCQERKVAQALAALGVECFLPIQKERRRWSDRTKVVDRLVLPHMIFIRTTLSRRVSLLEEIYGLSGYMTERGPYSPVIVPDWQMKAFILMVTRGETLVSVTSETFAPGDQVVIIEGPFKGMECEIINVDGRKSVSVKLGMLGTAVTEMPAGCVTKAR